MKLPEKEQTELRRKMYKVLGKGGRMKWAEIKIQKPLGASEVNRRSRLGGKERNRGGYSTLEFHKLRPNFSYNKDVSQSISIYRLSFV